MAFIQNVWPQIENKKWFDYIIYQPKVYIFILENLYWYVRCLILREDNMAGLFDDNKSNKHLELVFEWKMRWKTNVVGRFTDFSRAGGKKCIEDQAMHEIRKISRFRLWRSKSSSKNVICYPMAKFKLNMLDIGLKGDLFWSIVWSWSKKLELNLGQKGIIRDTFHANGYYVRLTT